MRFELAYVAVTLPLLLMYLLLLLRLVERRQIPPELRARSSPLPLRDTALVTLALDAAEIAQGLVPAFTERHFAMSLAVAAFLFILHLSVFLLATSRQQLLARNSDQRERSVTSVLLDSYLALSLLMTNATTIVIVIQFVGRAS